ncbi:MAG: primosome assembly protein PriA [Candidatus Saccharibacteria bacterium]|nr:primosome assembly protein PriA [Candidatus Saccharibacteria bacterium]
MYYYFVWVRSNRYHGKEALTYSHESVIKTGSLVEVEMQREVVMGVVTGATAEPRFKTKPIRTVYKLPPIPQHLLQVTLWLQSYYPAPLGIISQQLVPAAFSEAVLAKHELPQFAPPDPSSLPPLTAEQTDALAAMQARNSYLLHGTTGSGKTRLYIELALQTIAAGKSALILTPEISLTSQLAANFQKIFGSRVLVLHSQQAPAERRQAWLTSLRTDQPLIIIGPRSALFNPVRKLGLIVLDEAHEAAYKQEQAPQYQAGRVAAQLAVLTGAKLVLGSATPSVSDYFLALQKQRPIIELRHLARGELQPTSMNIIDMRERSLFSRSPYLSQPLIEAVQTALQRGEQTILYLNRRGTARMVLCEHCGWQADCPHCDLPLTYHGDRHELRCHSCDYHAPAPSSCPECGHPSILFKTAGTKAIVEEAERLFPQARIARFDTDNVRAERFEQHYEAITRGEVDILVGTQLLAKGLDLPKLSTLGVILADTSLYMPDFSAEERTYQLLNQVLGRVGRGHVDGHAFVQTYHPEHPLIGFAIRDDYQAFYNYEIAVRKQFLFPPFCFMLKLSCRRASVAAAEKAANKLRELLETGGYKVRVEGPAPSFYEKLQGKFQWQIIVKAVERGELLRIIADLPANWSYDIDPVDLL